MKTMNKATLTTLYDTHIQDLLKRHQALMQKHALDYLLIPSGEWLSIYCDDLKYPFKSSFLFRRYVPLMELASSYLVIGQSGKPCLIYYQPDDFWHSSPSMIDEMWSKHFDFIFIKQSSEAKRHFPPKNKSVLLLGESTKITHDYLSLPSHSSGFIDALDWERAYKSPYEIACLKEANYKAAYAHIEAKKAFYNGESEFTIHLAYLKALHCLEHQLPYSNIIALNEHASILHYMESSSMQEKNPRSFLIDAGASFNGYHADITRTYSYDTNDTFLDLIEALNQCQLNCIEQLSDCNDYQSLHNKMHYAIAKLLNEFDLVSLPIEQIVSSGISRAFFPHGLGHLIGLQVHDVGGLFEHETNDNNPFLRCTRTLKKNMALTIEPGIYFIPTLLNPYRHGKYKTSFHWKKIDQWMVYGGIRIEDTIITTDSVPINLTREAFLSLPMN
jgi:Xaa-Pro dipeptidase